MSLKLAIRASLFILVAVSLAAGAAHAKDCTEGLLGEWDWFTGSVVTIQADHTLLYDGNPYGTWKCDTPDSDVIRLEWNSGFTDRIKVKGDRIEGANNQGAKITAKRKKKSVQSAAALPKRFGRGIFILAAPVLLN
ncbi:MAG: hypothetical protein WAM91_05190 [Candidatus Acidiferrales bacterium]